MYDWQMNSANIPDLKIRDFVELNHDWRNYAYLNAEFGKMFPRLVDGIDGDIVHFKMGKTSVDFAAHTLSKHTGPRTQRKH